MKISTALLSQIQQVCRLSARCLSVRSLGIDILRDPTTNRGSAFTLKERQLLKIHGLLPPNVKSIEQQAMRCMMNLNAYENDLNKYIYLVSLQDRNEKLFYKVLADNIDTCMPLVYTPTVGLACQKFGIILRRPRGLYATIYDMDHIDGILNNWPVSDVKALVVTDGERILGLGDLGAYGMGIPIGKLSLYTALAGIQPSQCLPVTLDVGTDNETLLNDPLYNGMRHKRIRGARYDEFIDKFMVGVTNRYGPSTLIQFEDFGNHNAFRFLEKYRSNYCTFNDDIQGTASVAVAGAISAAKLTGTKLSDHTFVFQGAGEASIGIANLLALAMTEEGLSLEAARSKLYLVDTKGLITKDRPKGGITEHKLPFVKEMAHFDLLEDVINEVKPSVLIGAAAVGGVFGPKILNKMAELNDRPIIFALSNPTDKAECTAEEAYRHTEGRAIFASGSPFPHVTLNGREYHPGQGNNSYIFPGVALAVITSCIRPITDEIFLKAAQALSNCVTSEDLSYGSLYPQLKKIRKVSLAIATQVVEHAYKNGLAFHQPEPEDIRAFIEQRMYSPHYDEILPEVYDYPSDIP